MLKKKDFIPPTVYDIYIRGEEEKLNGVRKVVNELARYGGVDDLCIAKSYPAVGLVQTIQRGFE